MLLVPDAVDPASCPISKVPYDVLLEVFTQSMPERPLDSTRESITVLMPLCQVCSSWRSVALTSPSLWSHLHYNIIVQRINVNPGYAVRRKDLDFIKWWKEIQGSVLPFLHFTVTEVHPDLQPDSFEAGDSFDLILNYLAMARYMEISPFYWQHLRQRQIGCPNIQSLILSMRGAPGEDYKFFSDAQSVLGLQPDHTPSPLRHLSINCDDLSKAMVVPQIWFSLTRVSLVCGAVTLGFWYSLIGAVPNLQWGCFVFREILIDAEHPTNSEKYILPNLTTFSLSYGPDYDNAEDDNGNNVEIPVFFTGLSLPALETLSICNFADSWYDHRATTHIHTILQCAPNITTLTLGQGFLNLRKWSSRSRGPDTSYTDYKCDRADNGIYPIWTHAPHLEHLRLELPFSEDRVKYAIYALWDAVREVLSPATTRGAASGWRYYHRDMWLDLDNPACPIRIITVVSNQLDEISEDNWPKIPAKAPNVTLQFSSMLMGEGTASQESSEWGLRK